MEKKKKNKKRTYCCKSRDLQILFLSIDQTGILKLHFRVMRHVSPPPPNTPLILSYPSEISSCNQKAPKRQCTKIMHVRIQWQYTVYVHTYICTPYIILGATRPLVGRSYLKPYIISQWPMAPIASPLVTFKGRKKNSHVHQSPRHSLLCLLTPKRASTRSGIVSGAKVHTALIHPLGGTKFTELFSFSFFRHQPPGPSEFFWGSGKGACMKKKKKRVPKGGGGGGRGPSKCEPLHPHHPFQKKKKR